MSTPVTNGSLGSLRLSVWQSDGSSRKLVDLPAHASSDPLVSLLQRESLLSKDEMFASSYSQAAAYVMVSIRFKNDRQAVCAYLVLSDGALARRVAFAGNSVRVQPSLFDLIERIDEGFMPLPGRRYAVRAEQRYEVIQDSWEF
jgi:hypothetical protein